MRRIVIVSAAALALCACGAPEADSELGSGPDYEFMNEVMQTRAEVIWGSAGYIITAEGEQDLSPTTDEGWNEVRDGALAIMDAGEQLKTASFAPDDESWDAFAQGIVDAGDIARQAAEAHDAEAMFDVGAQLYRVCIGCHQFYRVGEFAPAE